MAFASDEQALDLILLLDSSGSMRRAMAQVKDAAEGALASLRRRDRVCLMVFSNEAREIVPFTDDLNAIADAMELLLNSHYFGNGGTRLQDATDTAAYEFISRHEPARRRRAVLAITDDLGRPARNQKAVVRDFWEADAVLNGLITPNRMAIKGLLASRGLRVPGGIEHIVEQTGGDFIRTEDIAAALPEMMHRIRSRYSLYYQLPEGKPAQIRHIRVELADAARTRLPGARAKSRQGYVWEPDQNGQNRWPNRIAPWVCTQEHPYLCPPGLTKYQMVMEGRMSRDSAQLE